MAPGLAWLHGRVSTLSRQLRISEKTCEGLHPSSGGLQPTSELATASTLVAKQDVCHSAGLCSGSKKEQPMQTNHVVNLSTTQRQVIEFPHSVAQLCSSSFQVCICMAHWYSLVLIVFLRISLDHLRVLLSVSERKSLSAS